MKLEMIYASKDLIPEGKDDLYTEQDGQFVFTGIDGIKTQTDLDKLQGALQNERDAHKATKQELNQKIQEANGKVSDLEGKVKEFEGKDQKPGEGKPGDPNDPNYLALKAELAKTNQALETIQEEKKALADQQRRSKILETMRKEATGKIRPEAISDLELHASNFDLTDSGQIVQKETGTSFGDWFSQTLESKPHWKPGNKPSGASGGTGQPGGSGIGDKQKKLNEFLSKDSLTPMEQAEATQLAEEVKAEKQASGEED